MNSLKKSILILSLLFLFSCNVYSETGTSAVTGHTPGLAGSILPRTLSYLPMMVACVCCIYVLYNTFIKEDGDEAQRLIQACQRGDLDSVKAILDDVEDINARREFEGDFGFSTPPISFACTYGDVNILRWFVEEKGADINKIWKVNSESPDESDLHWVLEISTNGKWTPLYEVYKVSTEGDPFESNEEANNEIKRRGAQMVDYLIENGADLTTPLYLACIDGKIDIVAHLLNNGAHVDGNVELYGATPLYTAVSLGKTRIVEELLEKGALVNAGTDTDSTPLHVAASLGSFVDQRILQLLLDNAADVNAHDNTGATPLDHAILNGGEQTVRILVENGADIRPDNDNLAPLMIAWHTDIMEYFLSRGVDINAETDDGKTALYFACKSGRAWVVEFLISKGAEVKDEYEHGGIRKQGDRALDFDVEKLLNEKVAKKKELEEAAREFIEGEQERETAKQKVKDLLSDTDVPAHAKKELLPQLFELHKNNEDLFSDIEFEKCLSKIAFDKKFLEEEKFKEIVEFVKAKKIEDLNGKLL